MRNPFDTDERRAFHEMLAQFARAEIIPYADAGDEAGEGLWSLHQMAIGGGSEEIMRDLAVRQIGR